MFKQTQIQVGGIHAYGSIFGSGFLGQQCYVCHIATVFVAECYTLNNCDLLRNILVVIKVVTPQLLKCYHIQHRHKT